MRAVWIIAAVAIVAAGAWLVIGGQKGEPVVSQSADGEVPVVEEATETAEEATDAVEDAVEQVQDAVNEVAEEAETAVIEAIDDAVDEANVAVDNAAEQISDAVSDVLGGEDDTASEADNGDTLLTALTVDGFNPEMLKAEVADSTMSPVQRLAAKVLIEQAEEDPGKIESVVKELRKALYVE